MDLDPRGAGPHELRFRRIPDVLHVDHRVTGITERVENPARRFGRGLGLDQRVGPAGKVVALDVDDQ
jgi:hypothetical protein